MIRKMKAVGLTLVAVFALSAVVASAASAANFTAASYPTAGSGGQTTKHVFTVQGSAVECSTANFTGELSAASSTIEITPSYSGCKAFGFLNATVNMNGCKYKFSITGGSVDNYSGGVVIVCTGSNEIAVTAATCTVHIPGQTPTNNAVSYKNETGTPNKVLVTSEVTGVHSNVSSGFLCPLESATTDTTGEYTGSSLFGATNGTTSVDIG